MAGNFPQFVIGFLFARIFCDAEEPGEDADYIAVENGCGLIESDAANGASGVASDAGQFKDLLEARGEGAPVFFHDKEGGFLHVSDAGVIAEALPELVDFLRGRFSERLNIGKLVHPTFPVGDDGFDLGLLEHDFGDPNGVGITGRSPGQVA